MGVLRRERSSTTTSPEAWLGSAAGAALKAGAIYVVLAGLWIVFSDQALAALVSDPFQLTRYQTYKGWAFVAASGLLVAALVHTAARHAQEGERRFRSLIERTLVGVYVIRGGKFVYVNEELARVFGYDASEMMGELPVREVVAPEDHEMLFGPLDRPSIHSTSADAPGLRFEFRGIHRSGEERIVEAFSRISEWEGERALVGVLIDRTELRRMESELQQAQRMEAIGQLTGAVAHDFNNLLTAIISPLELTLDSMEPEGKHRQDLHEVLATAQRAAVLTRQLLAFSRNQKHHPRAVDLSETIHCLSPLLSRLLPADVDFQIDSEPLSCRIEIDPSGLEQIILNLSVNARDAMPSGGVLALRTFETNGPPRTPGPDAPLRPGPYVCLEVRDTGVGMDETTRRHMFEPFFTTKKRGTGLGLATVFGWVKRSGGTIQVESTPGAGTRFRVFLPGTEAVAEETAPAQLPQEPPGGTVHRTEKGVRVLVVDDDEQVRKAVTSALTRFGHAVQSEPGVAEGRRFAEGPEGNVDLLVVDVKLADGHGATLARDYVTLHPSTRVLFISGYSDEDALEELDELPGTHFLEKPFTLDDLSRAVTRALEGPAAGW